MEVGLVTMAEKYTKAVGGTGEHQSGAGSQGRSSKAETQGGAGGAGYQGQNTKRLSKNVSSFNRFGTDYPRLGYADLALGRRKSGIHTSVLLSGTEACKSDFHCVTCDIDLCSELGLFRYRCKHLVMLTLMCLSQLIKQRSHQLWDSQSIYSSNGQRRAGLTTQRESRDSECCRDFWDNGEATVRKTSHKILFQTQRSPA
ncbi:hypothetical protein ROHU_013661 [Labeo rohita]|uniref:Uncharacterized protein n=1 Tax=Labeo rohita TaxID=84645 RepID=A0A498L3X6_LABRO|nr:hypothetical protein ROHU_013661 [Labeo rohita]